MPCADAKLVKFAQFVVFIYLCRVMRHLLVVILLLMAGLVATVTGCRGTRVPDDARLVAADSLLASAPDSTLALVEALALDSLSTDGDRAYRDLLLTQARYKCYITATSDSDINRALGYYRAHSGEQEKLTRAYIYKGAVMEELGHPDSAMFYYKHAEATAAPDDYFNLGYTKMRMGSLYRDHHAIDGKQIAKYEEALDCFNHTDKVQYQLICMLNLGVSHCLKAPNKADSLLNRALSIAEKIGDTVNYVFIVQNIVKKDIHTKQYEEAHLLVKKVLSLRTQELGSSFYIYAADLYACLQMPDSAIMLLSLADVASVNQAVDKLAYLDAMRDIAFARGDMESGHYYDKKGSNIEDSLFSTDDSFRIAKMEASIEEYSKNKLEQQHKSLVWIVFLIVIITLISIGLSLYLYRSKYRIHRLMKELKDEYQNHINDSDVLRHNIDQLRILDIQLKGFITSHLQLLGDVTEACYHTPNNTLSKEINHIIRFQKENKDKWTKLYAYLDIEFNNIISDTKKNYKQLNDRDILLLALSCLGYSCAQIAIITGYSNATSISGNRQRLIKKMGLDCSLNDYIAKYKS